jgi:hypothetical protein
MHILMLPIITIIYAAISLNHFGANWHPKSDAEMISNGIIYILWALTIIGVNQHYGKSR